MVSILLRQFVTLFNRTLPKWLNISLDFFSDTVSVFINLGQTDRRTYGRGATLNAAPRAAQQPVYIPIPCSKPLRHFDVVFLAFL